MTAAYILSIDQGTTSTRAIVYDASAQPLGSASCEFTQYYPRPGWVEHDADEIWQSVAKVVPLALRQAHIDSDQLTAIGITNQRETALAWQRDTGTPTGHAIVWQDRRTAEMCRDRADHRDRLHARTGLILDPYFSATKWAWMLEHMPRLASQIEAGDVVLGTVDTFLIARLTGNRQHVTDLTNASRTLLLDLKTREWDADLCSQFGIPSVGLPELRPSAANFGLTHGLEFLPDGIPITGVAGDQQAALFGQCCFQPGEAKCTYGTGAFLLTYLGNEPKLSSHQLVTTIAAMTSSDEPEYALEGSVFVAGATVQWLRDGLKLITASDEVEALAGASDPNEPLLFVPGFVGLGAPHWEPNARGAIFGLTRNTTAADLARAALEGVAFQVADLVEAMNSDMGSRAVELRADGGMARNDRFLQTQADLLGLSVVRPGQSESTALGAAFLAGLTADVWPDRDRLREFVGESARFEPTLEEGDRATRLARWRDAVRATVAFAEDE